MKKPIAPSDLFSKNITIEDKIIDKVNELIKSNWDGCKSIIYVSKLLGISDKPLYLIIEDIEYVYKMNGWHVSNNVSYLLFSKFCVPA